MGGDAAIAEMDRQLGEGTILLFRWECLGTSMVSKSVFLYYERVPCKEAGRGESLQCSGLSWVRTDGVQCGLN